MADSKPTVVVFTASSNTGSACIDHLLDNYADKVKVRGIVRKKGNIEEDVASQIEVVEADLTKPKIIGPAFKGANVAYLSTPADKKRVELSKTFIDMCFEHGVQYAVIMSYVGSETKETLYHRQFAEIEEYARSREGQAVKVAVGDRGHVKFSPIIVRAPPFYQNFYGSFRGIQNGTLYYPLEDGKLTHVDFMDVGKAIATILVDPAKHAGKAYNIIGDSHPGNMIASAISMKAGKQCKYESVDDETAVTAFKYLGLQEWIAEGNVEMLRFIREGGMDKYDRGDFQGITGDKPSRFQDFVRDYLKPMLD